MLLYNYFSIGKYFVSTQILCSCEYAAVLLPAARMWPDIMKNKLRCSRFLGALLASSEVFFNWACIHLFVNSVSCIGLQAHASAYHRCWSLILETILLPKHSKIILNQGKTKPQYEFAAMGTDLALYLKHFKGAWSLETLNLKTLAECCSGCSFCTNMLALAAHMVMLFWSLVNSESWKVKGLQII